MAAMAATCRDDVRRSAHEGDSVAKVAAALLWNSNLKETNRDVRAFGSMALVRVNT
jgi:hypothetical protein